MFAFPLATYSPPLVKDSHLEANLAIPGEAGIGKLEGSDKKIGKDGKFIGHNEGVIVLRDLGRTTHNNDLKTHKKDIAWQVAGEVKWKSGIRKSPRLSKDPRGKPRGI